MNIQSNSQSGKIQINHVGINAGCAGSIFPHNNQIQLNDGHWIGDYPPFQPAEIVPNCPNDYWPLDFIPYQPKTFVTTSAYLGPFQLDWKFRVVSVDVIELSTDVPGIKLADVQLDVDGRVLKFHGLRRDHDGHKSITRQFTLPDIYDTKSGEASLEDGVLRVTFKRKPEHKPRKIKVKVKR